MLTALAIVGTVIAVVGVVLLVIALLELGSARSSGKRQGIRNMRDPEFYTYNNEFKGRALAYAYDRGFKRGKKITHKRENAKNWGEEYTKAHDTRKAEADRIAKINGG